MPFDESEYGELVRLVGGGKAQIGIHTKAAANFLDKSSKEMVESVGEPADAERLPVRWSMFLASANILCSVFFAVESFGWWAFLAVPISFGVLVVGYTYSQLGPQRLALSTTFFIICIVILLLLDAAGWLKVWILTVVFSLYFTKLHFYFAHHLLRRLVMSNFKAFALLEGTVIQVRQ